MAKWSVKDIPSQAGKVAVVTGANSGIGWDTALELARAGGEVVMTNAGEGRGCGGSRAASDSAGEGAV
jgi:NAD(P)-dependent dehydrogenase (short-subunit alcohol dehydrogenase family)